MRDARSPAHHLSARNPDHIAREDQPRNRDRHTARDRHPRQAEANPHQNHWDAGIEQPVGRFGPPRIDQLAHQPHTLRAGLRAIAMRLEQERYNFMQHPDDRQADPAREVDPGVQHCPAPSWQSAIEHARDKQDAAA